MEENNVSFVVDDRLSPKSTEAGLLLLSTGQSAINNIGPDRGGVGHSKNRNLG